MHDEKIVNTLSYIADGVINMKMDGDKRFMQISKIKGTPCTREWLNVKMTKEGLDIVK